MSIEGRAQLPGARRVVVKVGSSSISGENAGKIQLIVEALADAHARGTEVVLGAHDGWLLTCSILTRASDGPMRGIHDRVPVILETDDVDAWLDPRQTDAAAAMAVAARETPDLRWYEVSRSVNTPRNNSPDLLEPVPDGETGHS